MISRFAPGGAHYDVTPVENLYIQSYMPEAPGEFVKVYLYALMLCYRPDELSQDLPDMARALRMNEDAVRAAFAYWEEVGLLRVVSNAPFEVELINLKQKFTAGTQAQQPQQNKAYQELAQQIQGIFKGERVVSPSEFARAFDWYEVLHFEQAAIAPLIQYCINAKGKKVSFNYIDTVAQSLAAKGTTTAEAVELWIMAEEAVNSGAGRVLNRWSLRRAPTVDEMLLYRKWTEEWGFTEDAVTAACKETTATDRPSFKYLDSILASFREEGATTARLIAEAVENRRRSKEIATDIIKTLGLRASASNSTELMNLYTHFTSMGFTDSSILMAARMLFLEGRSTLADLAARLNKWYEDGTVSEEALLYRSEKDGEAGQAVKYWLELWGLNRAPTAGEIAAYVRFTREWGVPDEVVHVAAERSAFAERPLAMMSKLVGTFREKGIRTRAQAEEECAHSQTAQPSRGVDSERDFANRNSYSREQLDSMDTDIYELRKRNGQ